MTTIFKLSICILVFGLFLSCEKGDTDNPSHLDSIGSTKYYPAEMIPSNYQKIYGKWYLFRISGGFSGGGYTPDYDFLEIRNFGIYGLVRNDSLIEYGKIEIDPSDIHPMDYLKIRLVADYHKGLNPMMDPPEKYVQLNGADTLNLISPCCDMYNYHFKRVR
jgi:hypothetical protein